MPEEPLHIFDPRRNFQLQGFAGRAATTTLHDATETGISISGIFQAAEDFAVLGWWNAYDYFNHLRLKHLPKTDLSGLKLEFDIEYDQTLDGAIRLDAAKYPSVSWDAMTFVTGKGDVHEVPLLSHASVVSGAETPAIATLFISGAENMDGGIDWLHLYFRDTRYTVTSSDCRIETRLTSAIKADDVAIPVQDGSGFNTGDTIWIERTGKNEEQIHLVGGGGAVLNGTVKIDHPSGSFVTRKTEVFHVAQKLAIAINTAGDTVAGRFGPDQSGVIKAQAWGGGIILTFALGAGATPRYGKLGNLDRVFLAHGRTLNGAPQSTGQGFQWTDGSGAGVQFSGGDNDTKYHIALDFTQELKDRNGVAVPMTDCRKIYMVFAPRFEPSEAELEDGCLLTSDVSAGDTAWSVDDSSKLAGGRYFIGASDTEERVQLLTVVSATQIAVARGYQSSTPAAWTAGARMKKLSPVSGFASDVEWGCTISNIAVTGDGSLKVGGGSARIEEADPRCQTTGYWEDYKYGAAGWPSQWWSAGHASRATPNDSTDIRKVSLRYSQTAQHDLYLGTFLNTDCGKVAVTIDGAEAAGSPFDLYLNEFGGTTANFKVAGGIAAGNHTVEIAALFQKNAASTGYYFYFDYLWPLVSQNVPDAPQVYSNVSMAIDFDTDHGYKKPPAWNLWQLQKLGFNGHADVYMGVFWNNKRRRINATYPYATVAFSGTPVAGDVVSFSIGRTTVSHAIGYGETLQGIVSAMRAAINGMFAGVWADNNFGSSNTLRIQSKAPSWVFTGLAVGLPNSVTLALSDHMGTAGGEGTWEMIDGTSPVMTEGARRWIKDLAGQFQAAGIKASFAFSMECYLPPPAMRAKYLSLIGGVVAPGADVDLGVPSHQMHFGLRVRTYLRQMYKECADQIEAVGLPVVLQFGETQWWYFDNRVQDARGGMPYYDQDTISEFAVAKGHQIWPFRANTDDPKGDPAHPNETADFLRDRIWAYCQDVITYVRSYHPAAVFECLWPLDANQGAPAPSAAFRALNFYVNLPSQWKNSSYGIKYFRCEGFDYDVWQKNSTLIRQTISFGATLGRPASECMFLSGLYGPPDPPLAQAYGMWLPLQLYSFCGWALDQFCLNSRPIPLGIGSVRVSNAQYFKPNAARVIEQVVARTLAPVASGAANQFRANTRTFND